MESFSFFEKNFQLQPTQMRKVPIQHFFTYINGNNVPTPRLFQLQAYYRAQNKLKGLQGPIFRILEAPLALQGGSELKQLLGSGDFSYLV